MVNFCAVYGCSNRSNRNNDCSYYRLPAIKANVSQNTKNLMQERRSVWLNKIRRLDLTPDKFPHTRVCSAHFVSGKLYFNKSCLYTMLLMLLNALETFNKHTLRPHSLCMLPSSDQKFDLLMFSLN